MEGLQRSEVSFRRQGSSGLVWDDRFLSRELNLQQEKQNDQQATTAPDQDDHTSNKDGAVRPSRIDVPSNDGVGGGVGGGYRAKGRPVEPEVEPPSPRVSTCGFCGAFNKKKSPSPAHNKHKARKAFSTTNKHGKRKPWGL